MPDVECRLEDVPEMGYTQNDKPFPRGEIVVRTKTVAAGYYKDIKTTQESFQNGWFRTGDIGQKESDGSVRIIDRKKFVRTIFHFFFTMKLLPLFLNKNQIFKLSQGEFISPAKIEGVCQKSKFVDQIFVTGNSFQSSIVSIVVVNSGIMKEWVKERKKDKVIDLENYDPIQDPELKGDILAEFVALSIKSGLANYEVIRNTYLLKEPFTVENGLLTSKFTFFSFLSSFFCL